MKKRMTAVLIGLVCAALMLAAGCQVTSDTDSEVKAKTGATTYPLTVTDDEGTQVTFSEKPQRIVSLAPANTEILFALGAGSLEVGRTDYCDYPAEAASIESIGDYNAPNVEKIISLKPDLVLATTFVDDNVRKQIENTGAKVLVFKATGIDGVIKEMIQVGEMVDANDKAKELTDAMTAKREKLDKSCAAAKTQKSVFIDLGDYYSSGENSLLGSELSELNVKNIAAGTGTDWPQLSVEKIIAANPDVYISFLYPADTIKSVAGFDQINAVKNGQLYAYDLTSNEANMIQRPGPRIVDGLEILAKDIYPDLVK